MGTQTIVKPSEDSDTKSFNKKTEAPKKPGPPKKKKNMYFDNAAVEQLLDRYVRRGCVDVVLRDEIMSHAEELIRQIIRAHNFEHIFPGRDQSSFGELFQVAWMQIEKTLYKYDNGPNSPKLFNMWCVKPDTSIFTEDGIKSISNAISDNNIKTYGLDGITDIVDSVRKDSRVVNSITTELGYEISCTPEHLLYKLGSDGPEWVKSCNIKDDDLIGIQYNQNTFIDDNKVDFNDNKWSVDEITEELGYIIGLYISEGCIGNNCVMIYNIDSEVINKLLDNDLGLSCKHYPDRQAVHIHNAGFVKFMESIGLGGLKASAKIVPDIVLRSSRNVVISVIKGMFDGDGHSSRHNGCVGYTSASAALIKQVRMLLLNLGILSKISRDNRIIRKFKVKDKKEYTSILTGSMQISLSSFDSLKYYEIIGFEIVRKQINVSNLKNIRVLRYGLTAKINELCEDNGISSRSSGLRSARNSKTGLCDINETGKKLALLDVNEDDRNLCFLVDRLSEEMSKHDRVVWLPVKSIEQSESEVCEIQVSSEYSSYIANGFISHNSQIAKTRILAYLKKEKRDKKNMPSYRDWMQRRYKTKSRSIEDFEEFLSELEQLCDYDDDFSGLTMIMRKLWLEDDKPYDGFKAKLQRLSGKDMNVINQFLRLIRLHRDEFSANVFDMRDFDYKDDGGYFYNDHDE